MNTTNTQDPTIDQLIDAVSHAAMDCRSNFNTHTSRRLTEAEQRLRAAIAALQPAAAQPRRFTGWLVSDSEGNDDFVNNPTALSGRHYKGGEPLLLEVVAAAQPQGFDAHDMATAAAEGFRDGVASVQPPGDAREAFPGWKWMTHPTRNNGQPMPVYIDQVDGETYYHPMEPSDATAFVWSKRDPEWREVQAAPAQASEPSAGLTDEQRLAWCLWRIKDLEQTLAKFQAAPARAVEPLTDAIATEREACAKAAEEVEEPQWFGYECPHTFQDGKLAAATAIRARGITTTPAAKEQS